MAKAADAFRTISEVADDLDVPKHVLRFWEGKFPQLRPMKRGGGRRFYRPEDVDLLKGIRHLLYEQGYTIKGVQKILREQGIDSVKQHGRGDAAPVTTMADARALPANVPAIGGAASRGRGAAAVAARRAGGRGRANAAEQLATVEAAIKELELCRSILLETIGKKEPVRAPRRARAVGA